MAGGIFDRRAGGGIFGARRARRMAEAAETDRLATLGGLDIGVDELIDSTADPAEAAAWRDQMESNLELARSTDPEQQRTGLTNLAAMQKEVIGAIDRRHERQSTFIVEQARDLRERSQKALEPMRQMQSNLGQMNALLKDPEFEQNLAVNRGYLMQLIQGSTRQMLADPEDMADALMNAGAGGGIIASLIKFAGGALAAEDFDFQKSDYERLATAMYTFNEKRYRDTMAPIAAEAVALDQAAGQLDFLPAGYSLTQYITGNPEDFQNPIEGNYPEGPGRSPVIPPLEQVQSTVNKLLDIGEGGGIDADPNRAAAGPQFSGVMGSGVNVLDRVLGYDDSVLALNAEVQRLSGEGATVRADPASGALYAIYSDGRREPLQMNQLQRGFVLRDLERPKQHVEGRIQR